MQETYLKWINHAMSGGNYKFNKFYRSLITVNPSKEDLAIYFTLRAILEIRLNLIELAQKSNINAKKSSKNNSAISEFLSGVIEHVKGNTIDAKKYFNRCLAIEPTFYPAQKMNYILLSKNFSVQEVENLFKKTINEEPQNTRLLIECFLFFQLNNASLNFLQSLLAKETLGEKTDQRNFIPANNLLECFDFKDLVGQYYSFCIKALEHVENIFATKIEKNFQAWQSICRLEDTLPVVGEALTRAKPVLKNGPDTKNKGLQMLCSPGYWTTSQNHLLYFILSELLLMRTQHKKDDFIRFHEIGPGSGYLMFLVSKLSNVIVSGSDCYDKNSFDIKSLMREQPIFSEKVGSQSLEHLCYYIINEISGMLKYITCFPITKKSFPPELIEADIVYSHLPVIDLYEEEWGVDDWKLFFENIFTAPGSKVKTIIIAGNSHSKNMAEYGSKIKNNFTDSFSLTFIKGDFCSGNVLIARKI